MGSGVITEMGKTRVGYELGELQEWGGGEIMTYVLGT